MSNLKTVTINLTALFNSQLEIYKQLTRLTSSISAEVARTKGNMSGLTAKFEQENTLLDQIVKLKEQASGDIEIWLAEKQNASSEDAKKLDEIIKSVQEEISRFLNTEKMLKKQIDYYRTKDENAN
jgi:hypothetical protein